MRTVNLKSSGSKSIATVIIAFAAFITVFTAFAVESPPEGIQQVWTSAKGNIIYYVKPGEKVKKGAPLFYIVNGDTSPAMFFQKEHRIEFYRLIYERRKKLFKTRTVSQEAYDNALHDYITAKDEMAKFLAYAKQAYYTAPFDCEVIKLLYLQNSGIKDGNPAINIKCIDKDYEFIPPKPNEKFLQVLNKVNEHNNLEMEKWNIKDLKL